MDDVETTDALNQNEVLPHTVAPALADQLWTVSAETAGQKSTYRTQLRRIAPNSSKAMINRMLADPDLTTETRAPLFDDRSNLGLPHGDAEFTIAN